MLKYFSLGVVNRPRSSGMMKVLVLDVKLTTGWVLDAAARVSNALINVVDHTRVDGACDATTDSSGEESDTLLQRLTSVWQA